MSYFHAINGQGGSPEPTPSNDHPPVLLWTNPNPSNAFTAQTVELDLSQYVGVIVESFGDAGNDFISSRDYIKKDDTIAGTDRYMSIGSRCDINTSGSIVRTVTALNNNGITFGDAKQGTTVKNDSVIPYKIYGVQEYVVEEKTDAPVLLWTNPSPTSSFEPQKIDLDLSNYDGVIIEFMSKTDVQTSRTRVLYFIGETDMCAGVMVINNYSYQRGISVAIDGVTIAQAQYGTNANSVDNTGLPPYKIYGVKLSL